MFVGSKFCGHCGARAEIAEPDADGTDGSCPRCKIQLMAMRIGDIAMRECSRCGGIWTLPHIFEAVCSNKEAQAAVLGYVSNLPQIGFRPLAVNYVPCPDCGHLMNRSNFARSSGVIIDMCKGHGVWFDSGELQNIIDFIDKGGLSKQREKEKAALDDERSRLRDEQRRITMLERRSGGKFNEPFPESGLTGLLKKLFD